MQAKFSIKGPKNPHIWTCKKQILQKNFAMLLQYNSTFKIVRQNCTIAQWLKKKKKKLIFYYTFLIPKISLSSLSLFLLSSLFLVNEWLLHIVNWVELGSFDSRSRRLGLSIMARENAVVFGLDSPKASLVVHLGPGVLADPTNQIWVPANLWGPLLWCHWN